MSSIQYSLIPCAGFVGVLLIVFGFLAYSRYLRHKEVLLLAEKGLVYPERKNGKDVLRWGIVITAIGLALLLGLLPLAIEDTWILLLPGLLCTFFGLSLVLIYVLTRPVEVKSGENHSIEGSEGTKSL